MKAEKRAPLRPDAVERGDAVAFEVAPARSRADVEACARLMASSEPWITLQRTYETSLENLSDVSKETYVALVGGELAGFITLNLTGAFRGYIQTIALKPKYRGKSIGRGLIRFAEERIFRDHPNVFICVSSFNPRARQLYESLGYRVVGDLADYVVSGHSEILLRKTIAPLTEFKPRATKR